MAIVVEEGKKRFDFIGIAGWFIFLALALAAVYYIFFTNPELVTVPDTGTLSTIAPITQLALHPQDVIGGTQFQSLHSNITLPTPQGPAGVGRPNPFIAP